MFFSFGAGAGSLFFSFLFFVPSFHWRLPGPQAVGKVFRAERMRKGAIPRDATNDSFEGPRVAATPFGAMASERRALAATSRRSAAPLACAPRGATRSMLQIHHSLAVPSSERLARCSAPRHQSASRAGYCMQGRHHHLVVLLFLLSKRIYFAEAK